MRLPRHMYRSLLNREYRLLWLAGIGASIGEGMQSFLLAWCALELTDSIYQVGVVAFLHGLSMLLALLFGGVIVDRMNRTRVLIIIQFLLSVIVALLGVLILLDWIHVWHLYVIAALTGIIHAPMFPARVAIMGDVVPRADTTNAVALNMLLINMSWIVGAPFAGALVNLSGTGLAFLANGVIFLAGIPPIFLIRYSKKVSTDQIASFLSDLIQGVKFISMSPLLLSLIGLEFVVAFFAEPYSQLLPAFGREVLELDAFRAGLLLLMVGLGALSANLLLANLTSNSHTIRLFLGAMLLFGICLSLLAISPWFASSLVILFFLGLGEFAFIALGTIIIMLTAPSQMMGRVQSMWTMGGSLLYIGALPMGFIGENWGLRIAFIVGAVICVTTWLIAGILLPYLRRAQLK